MGFKYPLLKNKRREAGKRVDATYSILKFRMHIHLNVQWDALVLCLLFHEVGYNFLQCFKYHILAIGLYNVARIRRVGGWY